jgi:3-oxoadipate enol-lactonase
MINGFRRSRVVWLEGVLKPLAERFQLILMDNRGTGQSDKPRDGYSIEAFADDCAGVIAPGSACPARTSSAYPWAG